MRLYPAIDLLDGKAVRLKRGDYAEVTVYSDTPWEVACSFEKMGADFIHLVDLNGAKDGERVNEETVKKIVSSVNIGTEIGGGIRNLDDIEAYLKAGITRVIIGTKAVTNPEFVKEAVEKFGSDRIVVGIDAKNGFVATRGWLDVSVLSAVELGLKMKSFGVKTVIYTDISKDGCMMGPNYEETLKLKNETGLEVVLSGGISSLEDVKKANDYGMDGTILGKALYEGVFTVKDAVALISGRQM